MLRVMCQQMLRVLRQSIILKKVRYKMNCYILLMFLLVMILL